MRLGKWNQSVSAKSRVVVSIRSGLSQIVVHNSWIKGVALLFSLFQNKTIFLVLGVLVCSRQRPVTPVGWRLGSGRLVAAGWEFHCLLLPLPGHYQLQHSTHTECCLHPPLQHSPDTGFLESGSWWEDSGIYYPVVESGGRGRWWVMVWPTIILQCQDSTIMWTLNTPIVNIFDID